MPSSPGSLMICVRRASANLSRISVDLVGDHAAKLAVVGQDRLELGDGLAQLGHLLFEVRCDPGG